MSATDPDSAANAFGATPHEVVGYRALSEIIFLVLFVINTINGRTRFI